MPNEASHVSEEERFADALRDDDGRAGDAADANWLACRCGTQLYVIPLEHVTEIMRPLSVEPIAGAPDYVRGACILRGVPVPVVDAGLLVGGKKANARRMVSLKAGSRAVALLVDAVSGICRLEAGQVASLPPLLRDAAHETVASIGALDAALLVSLRTARLVPDDVFIVVAANGVAA